MPHNQGMHIVKPTRGFTLVELLFLVVIMSILVGLAYPHINSAIDQAGYMECESRLEMLRRAKSAYVLSHPGEGEIASDQAMLRSYFPQRFEFNCPRLQTSLYSHPYELYQRSSCQYCLDNPLDSPSPDPSPNPSPTPLFE